MRSDLEIIEEIRNSNIESFKILIERYENCVMAVLNNRLPHDAVPDVAQDLFIQVFRSLDKYRATSPFEHWIKRIALRCCYDYWRKTYRKNEHCVSALTDEQQNWLDSCGMHLAEEEIVKQASQAEARELLAIVLKQLKPLDRALIDMVYFNDMTIKEAAGSLELNGMLAKVRISRARKKMHSIIEQLINEKKV